MNRPFRVMGGVYDICLACIWLILWITQIKHRLVQYPVILDSLMNRPFRVMGGVYDICLACIWLILWTHPNKAQTRSISSDIGQLNK